MPSRKVLRRAARRADRAMEFFLSAGERLRRPGAGAEDPLGRSALIDAWLVHLHALLDFFHPTGAARTDALLAEHYFRSPETWTRRLPKLTARQRRRRTTQRDALVALTFRRRARAPGWTQRDHRLLEIRIRLFVNLLPARRRRWFPQTARRLSTQMDLLDAIRESAHAAD
jgi:hypothetical protein